MNLPKWLITFFEQEFNSAQVAIINKNWWNYTCISLSNSTRDQLMCEANSILSITSSK